MRTKKTMFLTGANGLVGRNILEHSKAANWNILAPGSVEVDLTNWDKLNAYLDKNRPDIIVHCAGYVGGIQANITHPVTFLERNLAIGRNTIMAAHNTGVRHFLNLGSTCMYPRAAPNPLKEDAILTGELEPTNEGYALAKIAAARLCQYICREDPLARYKTIIPCNLFGRHDKWHPKHSHLLPAIMHKIHLAKVNGEPTVEIWGDGTARREFMYAGDLADAILRAADDIDAIPELMNCGVGHDYTINEYYSIVAKVVGWDGEFIHDTSRPVGMKQKLCSVARQTDWGWRPQTVLEDGIKMAYNYYLNEDKR